MTISKVCNYQYIRITVEMLGFLTMETLQKIIGDTPYLSRSEAKTVS